MPTRDRDAIVKRQKLIPGLPCGLELDLMHPRMHINRKLGSGARGRDIVVAQ